MAPLRGEGLRSENPVTLNSTLQELGAGIGIAIAALFVRLGEPLGAAIGLGTTPDTAYRIAFILLAVLLLLHPRALSRPRCHHGTPEEPADDPLTQIAPLYVK